MAKIHAVIIDAEVENEETIRSLLSAIHGTPRPEVEAPAAVVLEEPRQLLPFATAKQTRPKKARASATAHETEAPARTGPPSIGERVLEALRRKPLSSLELVSLLKAPAQNIYAACSYLKSKGKVDSRTDDDGDGTRRWFVR